MMRYDEMRQTLVVGCFSLELGVFRVCLFACLFVCVLDCILWLIFSGYVASLHACIYPDLGSTLGCCAHV